MSLESFSDEPFKFASLMAHQLQAPLNAVNAALQTVLAEYTGPLLPRQRESLEKAGDRCQQAISSVQRMLAIVKAEQGQAPGPPAPLLNVVERTVAQYQSEAVQTHMVLESSIGVGRMHVRPGEAALSEALSALVHNALKYTPDYGRIRVSVEPATDADRVVIRVSDSGGGVPEAYREQIFEPFYRTPAARGSARPGVGLGLAFVSSIVKAAGGSIHVGESEFGGAEFVLNLPVAESPDAAAGGDGESEPEFRVVIVGGVTAGPKAAAKIIRLRPDTDVTVIERGSIMSYAGCGLPYYVSGEVREQQRLISSPAGVVRDPVFFRRVMNVHVLNQTEATAINRERRTVGVRDCLTGQVRELPYDKLLLATGASAVIPAALNTPLRNVFTLHGVRDAEGIRSALSHRRARDVVIVGGGLIGIEMTEALASRGARITIVEQHSHILPIVDTDIARLVEKHLEANGIRILTETTATALRGESEVEAVETDRGTCNADLVILACGIKPNTDLAESACLERGRTGAIAVNDRLQTSDADIYAAGDCAETLNRITGAPCYFPLGSTASKQGRVAAVNLCGGDDVFPGVLESCICKVFDYCVARTGLGETQAREAGYETVTVLAPGPDRAHFMPTARMLLLKLVVDRASRRLLGLQATGPGAADKRLDTAMMAIASGMTVDELANADFCYAPQYSTAMDSLITAANVARNKLDGLFRGVAPSEVRAMQERRDDFVFLDVRTPEESDQVRLPGSTLIPLGALRERLTELPRDSMIVLFCDISLRGYEGALILRAAGFNDVRVMEGGIAMWPYETVD